MSRHFKSACETWSNITCLMDMFRVCLCIMCFCSLCNYCAQIHVRSTILSMRSVQCCCWSAHPNRAFSSAASHHFCIKSECPLRLSDLAADPVTYRHEADFSFTKIRFQTIIHVKKHPPKIFTGYDNKNFSLSDELIFQMFLCKYHRQQ